MEGAAADFFSLDPSSPALAGKAGDAILDAWIFAASARVDCAWVRGNRLVEGGRHIRRAAIAEEVSAGDVEACRRLRSTKYPALQ